MIDLTVLIKSFVGHPYWPEREQYINITKESGQRRARSTANARKALEEYLRANNMTLDEFETLGKLADRPFHIGPDGRIVIPKHQVDGMLTAACDEARAASRPCPPDQVRVLLRSSPWHSDRSPDDALEWQRYVVVSSGTGAKLSNQRALRVNSYVGAEPPGELAPTKPMLCTGSLDIDPAMVKPDVVRNLLSWAGQWVGIGASRKMGWGRFELISFDQS